MRTHYETVTIPSGGTASAAVRTEFGVPAAIVWPAAMTSTTATLEGSADGNVFAPFYDSAGAPVTIAIVPGGISILGWEYALARFVRVSVGTAEAAERQVVFCVQEQ